MKNIQIIDGALNCSYNIYVVSDRVFGILFPREGQDIEFSEDAFGRLSHKAAASLFKSIWKRRIKKNCVHGIHGTMFFGLRYKKEFYPNKRDADLLGLRLSEGRFTLKK